MKSPKRKSASSRHRDEHSKRSHKVKNEDTEERRKSKHRQSPSHLSFKRHNKEEGEISDQEPYQESKRRKHDYSPGNARKYRSPERKSRRHSRSPEVFKRRKPSKSPDRYYKVDKKMLETAKHRKGSSPLRSPIQSDTFEQFRNRRPSRSPERASHRNERKDKYAVGSRYYEPPKEVENLPVDVPREDYVVGKRYYTNPEDQAPKPIAPAPPKKTADPISSKTGGAYIPPAMLKMMQASITDKSSAEYQRISWEALKKSIHGLINKVNRTNIDKIIRQLLRENIVRGRGLLCRSLIQAQSMSVTFTPVYAALVALINSRFPNIGELLLKRLVIQFRRGFKRNDKVNCIAAGTFIAHLVNQRVSHEILALEILTLLVETPNDDSIEVAIAFLKESGMKLTEVSSKGVDAIIQMLRNVLHERTSDSRSMHMIEVIMQIRKDKFKDNPSIPDGLDLVEEDDQFTHLITLDDATDAQDILNVFKVDPEYLEHEEKYKELSKEIVGDVSDDDEEESGEEGDEEDESEEAEEDGEQAGPAKQTIIDNTETNLVALRRTIYLTIYSSLDFEECAHKLMRMNLKPGQEPELCAMILDCCCEMRTYERFFGLLAQRFCQLKREYIPPFEALFRDTYNTVHRLKTNQCRNVAKLFGHLLFTDAISWEVLMCIRLNEEDTTSSGRIFIKILFHELSEYMGLGKLNDRVKDGTLQEAFTGLFPRDNPRNTRFSINFFTSIGLGGLTDDLRDHLKNAVQSMPAQLPVMAKDASSSSSVSSSSDSEDDLSDSSSDDSDTKKKRRKKSKKVKKDKSAKKEKIRRKSSYKDSRSEKRRK